MDSDTRTGLIAITAATIPGAVSIVISYLQWRWSRQKSKEERQVTEQERSSGDLFKERRALVEDLRADIERLKAELVECRRDTEMWQFRCRRMDDIAHDLRHGFINYAHVALQHFEKAGLPVPALLPKLPPRIISLEDIKPPAD